MLRNAHIKNNENHAPKEQTFAEAIAVQEEEEVLRMVPKIPGLVLMVLGWFDGGGLVVLGWF
jgi:hypothetical protein